ncbi:MAG TPA: DUF1080 domain-containing protein [Bryobacteraceae bacterium]|nr:DUF1080 domain-containing protein [Bryobacteraceae bacterium]
MRKWFGLAALAAAMVMAQAARAADNQLTPGEKSAGWRLLFDGRTYAGWRDPTKLHPPGDSFIIEDGCLKAVHNPRIVEDLFTSEEFGDFELGFDWKISPAGNSGVKYRIQDHIFIPEVRERFEDRVKAALLAPRAARPDKGQDYVIGFEYQLTDDVTNPDARFNGPKHQTAALYDVAAPSKDATRPVGEFNHSVIVVKGERVKHYLNGEVVVETSLKSPDVAASMEKRWGKDSPVYGLLVNQPRARCPISLQNHGDEAWFKNVKIRILE